MSVSTETSTVASRQDQLAGYRIAVTADRRAEDQIAAFTRRGAEVIHAPTLRLAAADDDASVVAETEAIVNARPDILLVTTSYGMRRWLDVADAAGVGGELIELLEETEVLVRGPKARGAVRAAGLEDAGMSTDETTQSLVDLVLHTNQGFGEGRAVAVQLHGYSDDEQLDRLRRAGFQVLTVAPYNWHPPHDPAKVGRLIELICARQIDAVTFTSAPAAQALFTAAEELDTLPALLAGLNDNVLVGAVGPVTAEPLRAYGIDPLVPGRYRMGALIRSVCDQLANGDGLCTQTPFGPLELRGNTALLAGASVKLSPSMQYILRALLKADGQVVSKLELSGASADVRAVEMSMSRLRQALPEPQVIETVVKRGYRIVV